MVIRNLLFLQRSGSRLPVCPWFWPHAGEISCAMDDCQNLNSSFPQPVDHSIALDEKFTDLWVRGFRNKSATFRKRGKSINREDEALNNGISILSRVSGNVVLDVLEIGNGGRSPLDGGHFLRKRFFTASCGITFPSSAA